MADHPLRSATDRRLGRPLPHQPANQTQAHPLPINLWLYFHVNVKCYEVLITVSSGYPSVRGRLPTRYSPVRRYQLPLSTEVSIRSFPLDLHVLGTPPAFILSQDQTLKLWYITRLSTNNIWLKRTHLRFAVIVVFQRNCTRTLKHRLIVLTNHCWLYFVHLNLMEAFASIEKNSIFSFDSISTLCSFQCARARFRFAPLRSKRNVYYFTSFGFDCQELFSSSFNVRSLLRRRHHWQLLYSTKPFNLCQLLFSSFLTSFAVRFSFRSHRLRSMQLWCSVWRPTPEPLGSARAIQLF